MTYQPKRHHSDNNHSFHRVSYRFEAVTRCTPFAVVCLVPTVAKTRCNRWALISGIPFSKTSRTRVECSQGNGLKRLQLGAFVLALICPSG